MVQSSTNVHYLKSDTRGLGAIEFLIPTRLSLINEHAAWEISHLAVLQSYCAAAFMWRYYLMPMIHCQSVVDIQFLAVAESELILPIDFVHENVPFEESPSSDTHSLIRAAR